MSNLPAKNPLLEPQREKAGAETFAKYSYQYNWALYRILKEHEKKNEYAVFVEYHEDVVIANSLDADKARYEFNQIKTIDRVFSVHELTKVKKTKAAVKDEKEKSDKSVLGKLLDSSTKKKYKALINEINLVSVKGFSLTLKNPGIKLEVIKVDDIDDSDLKAIEKKLKEQLICDNLPSNLRFVIPEVPELGCQKYVLGEVATLLHSLFPSDTYKPFDIYILLYDELTRKGMNTNDYTEWDDLLSKKALTSKTVTSVINQFTRPVGEIEVERKFNEMANELGYTFIKRNKLKQNFERYRQSRIGKKDSLQLETTEKIRGLLEEKIDQCDEDVKILISLVLQELPVKITQQFMSNDHVTSAIMCEYIMLENNG